jgi:hypothetical protein
MRPDMRNGSRPQRGGTAARSHCLRHVRMDAALASAAHADVATSAAAGWPRTTLPSVVQP